MRSRGIWVSGGALAVATLLSFLIGPETFRGNRPASPVIGNARALQASYERWKAQYERTEGGRRLVLSLGYSKGLSAGFSRAQGQITLDLADGTTSVEISGLGAEHAFEVWLVDNRPGSGRSVKPEPGDAMLRIGSLKPTGSSATLETRLDRARLAGFQIDLVVVTRAGETPVDGGLLFGSPTLFQRIYYSQRAGRLATFAERGRAGSDNSGPAANLLAAPFRALVPAPAYAQSSDLTTALATLVQHGENLFFKGTFNGNGRTCGTCHPAENNFTIDPAFIQTLPPNNPLFVAEFIPALSENFENPTLMRQFGLILENVDGSEDLDSKFVMRGVPHTLALRLSVGLPPAPPRTGWGGDGAPGSGSLRDFATGAVMQHFTKTLARGPGTDFRLPSPAELDAMEAFQLSLGRQDELDLTALLLVSPAGGVGVPNPETGRQIFLNNDVGKCNRCHRNAGSNNAQGANQNFDSGVETALNPAGPLPPDGGLGLELNATTGGFGNGTFNTPPLVEAADTGPFFHNNLVATIEEAVRFYTTPAFNESTAGKGFPGQIALTEQQIADVAAFLRAINALENIRSSLVRLDKAKLVTGDAREFGQLNRLLALATVDVRDAIKVLAGVGLYQTAVDILREDAVKNLVGAMGKKTKAQRDAAIDQAIAAELSARTIIQVLP